MRIIVGLGNPGSEYDQTRHNIGYEVVDALAVRWGWTSRTGERKFNRLARSKFDGLALDGQASGGSGEKILLLKPTTYMNLSGKSVAAAANFYQVSPADELLVVLDHLALPCGKIRLRAGGSSGGHNGLKDIERALGTSQYPRLRIGIDPPPPPMAGKDYVLGRWSPEQKLKITGAIERACDAIELWIDKGTQAAMNRFNAPEEDNCQ